MKKLFLTFGFLFICFISANAQSCVYFCSTTGASGWAHGYNNSCDVAYKNCINYGGQNPQLIISTNSKGFGAIYLGKNRNGVTVIGASAGYPNLKAAQNAAKSQCIKRGGRNVYLKDSWNDR